MEDGIYWLEDAVSKIKRYFTVKDGFVESGIRPSASKLHDFFYVAAQLGYTWGSYEACQ